ncbi:adenylate/guanylate cyclase domain-containing protein [Marinobacterium rhizophilum]|uniref:AAA family ATPase n=1 Tax=Marinobacterium rhizophilum TaxID=420402 RepID=A0ABY5HIZ3_9GAMM|nr:adenylate/guanylate cyclase domain-containing protein [Marinobacterium rhizophilum]UTW12345.1 AAA family ATPase [Marinobacterium rhizophilum]
MQCKNCERENPSAARFCEHCGVVLTATCPRCGYEAEPSARFCHQCGHPLGLVSEAASADITKTEPHEEPGPETVLWSPLQGSPTEQLAERKIITALFADIANSTALISALDPEDAGALIDPVLAVMVEAVEHYGGYVAKSMGDGILALFGAPISHEDHPRRALYAALRMQEALSQSEAVPRIRVGIHTAEVVVRTIASAGLSHSCEPVGNAIHIASRLEGQAEPGTILVSEQTFGLTDGYVNFKPLGPHTLKGVSEPVQVYQAVNAFPLRTRLQVAERRGLVRFVGRKDELAVLRNVLPWVQNGHGRLLAVSGDPGVGKSRLFHEFKDLLPDTFTVLETFSVSHGKAFAYMPLIELLKQCFRLSEQDKGAAWRHRIESQVHNLGGSLQAQLPYLYFVLGVEEPTSTLATMDAQVRRLRVFEAIRRLLVQVSSTRPLVLIFEDLQWLDSETESFIRYLSESLNDSAILLLLNFRPEYAHDWLAGATPAPLRLEVLDTDDSKELLNVLLGSDASLLALKIAILERTEGNPFFTEEVVQTLVEEGVLKGRRGDFKLSHRPQMLHIPVTVQGVLNARIDRLGNEEKRLLQRCAVVGKRFTWSLAQAVVDLPPQRLRDLLLRLQAREYLFECPAFPEVEYSFKHGLTHQVAYDSLLHSRRSELHESIAVAIERQFSSDLDNHYTELAHHYRRSNNGAKAVEYLRRAGQHAVQHCANLEAIDLLEAALHLLPKLPDETDRIHEELTLQLNLGLAWMAVRGYGANEVELSYRRALELCPQAAHTSQHFTALMGLNAFYLVRGQLQDARTLAEQLITLAGAMKEPVFFMHAHRTLGVVLFFIGDFVTARAHLEQALSFFDPHQQYGQSIPFGMDTEALVLPFLALVLAWQGLPDQALQYVDDVLRQNTAFSQPLDRVFALGFAAELHLQRGETQLSLERAGAAIALADEQGFPFWSAWAAVVKGRALGDLGQVDEGLRQLQQGVAEYQATGANLWQMHFMVLLAGSLARAGLIGQARSVLTQARLVQTQERFYIAELYRLQGVLTLLDVENKLMLDRRQRKAEHCYHRAMDIARVQGARLLELRAACDLGRLWLNQGRRSETRELLTALSGLFNEGFETADIKASRALIDRCNDPSSIRNL